MADGFLQSKRLKQEIKCVSRTVYKYMIYTVVRYIVSYYFIAKSIL